MNFGRHTYTHVIPVQYPPHKCLPKKSCLHSLRILIMSWLFKDPVNSGLNQFDHPNQTVKHGLKAKKIKLPQMNPFLEKQLIKFSCTYWPFLFCRILKKLLGPIHSFEEVQFSGPKRPNCHEQNFFGTNHYYFHLPTGPFHSAKRKKILTADPELWGCAIFGSKMVDLPQIFFRKLLTSFLSTY